MPAGAQLGRSAEAGRRSVYESRRQPRERWRGQHGPERGRAGGLSRWELKTAPVRLGTDRPNQTELICSLLKNALKLLGPAGEAAEGGMGIAGGTLPRHRALSGPPARTPRFCVNYRRLA